MPEPLRPPAPRPCVSCPYRKDVPSGVWDQTEYARLRVYDLDVAEQAMAGETGAFGCHQNDGRLCAGWVACHGTDTLGIRLLASYLSPHQFELIRNYETDVEIFATGAEACEHGLRDVAAPGPEAIQMIDTLIRKQRRQRESK